MWSLLKTATELSEGQVFTHGKAVDASDAMSTTKKSGELFGSEKSHDERELVFLKTPKTISSFLFLFVHCTNLCHGIPGGSAAGKAEI